MTKKKDERLSDKRAQFGHVGTRNGNDGWAMAKPQLVAVGVALRRRDIVQVHHKGTVTLEDVLVFAQLFEYGGKGGV